MNLIYLILINCIFTVPSNLQINRYLYEETRYKKKTSEFEKIYSKIPENQRSPYGTFLFSMIYKG